MKKVLRCLLLCLIISLMVCFTSCSGSNSHIHTEGDWIIVKDATCSEEGKKEKVCTDCKKLLKEQTITKLEHVWDNGEITTEPTKENDGVKTYTCSNCNTTKTETVKYEVKTTVTLDEWKNAFVEHENCTIQYFFYYSDGRITENIIKLDGNKCYYNVPEENHEGIDSASGDYYELYKMIFFYLIMGENDSLYNVIVNKMDSFTYEDGVYKANGKDIGAKYHIDFDELDLINEIFIKFENEKLLEVRFNSYDNDGYSEEVVVSNIGTTVVK